MRNGNRFRTFTPSMVGGVLTVPMRNGNRGSFTSGFFPSSGSYRTYEEWKRRATSSSELGKISVLTVPMRNGNQMVNFQKVTEVFCSYRTYEEWKPRPKERTRKVRKVLTVPMRNGNVSRHVAKSLPRDWFLPYLWGMETYYENGNKEVSELRSYRTYEEWKQ